MSPPVSVGMSNTEPPESPAKPSYSPETSSVNKKPQTTKSNMNYVGDTFDGGWDVDLDFEAVIIHKV